MLILLWILVSSSDRLINEILHICVGAISSIEGIGKYSWIVCRACYVDSNCSSLWEIHGIVRKLDGKDYVIFSKEKI